MNNNGYQIVNEKISEHVTGAIAGGTGGVAGGAIGGYFGYDHFMVGLKQNIQSEKDPIKKQKLQLQFDKYTKMGKKKFAMLTAASGGVGGAIGGYAGSRIGNRIAR